MDYENYDLRIGEWDPATRRAVVEVLQSPAGESQRAAVRLGPGRPPGRLCPYSTQTAAREAGRGLSRSVLAGEVGALWAASYQIARERGRGLRLRLHIDVPELTALPWELLYDETHDDFLVFDQRISLVRYMRLPTAPPMIRPSGSLSILAVAADPIDAVRLDEAGELRHLREALGDLVTARRLTLSICEHATLQKLTRALLDGAPDVVHFIGHGQYVPERQQGYIILEDARGRAAPVAANDIARLLHRYGTSLVVLNACESAVGAWAGLGPALVRADVPAVVAMQWPVEDQAAMAFGRAFYRSLSLGRTIDECVAEGRVGVNVMSRSPCDWAAPVLFLRSPSGCLWLNDADVGAHPDRQARPEPDADPLARGADGANHQPTQPGPFFKTHGALRPSEDRELIVERPALQQALRLARQPAVTQYIAVLSPRQTGKTTFLFQLYERLRERMACVFTDLSVLRGQDARAAFRLVASRIVASVRPCLRADQVLPDPNRVDNSVAFVELAEAVARVAPTPRIVLLMDEVGGLPLEVSDVFFNTLRAIFTQGRGGNAILSKYLFVFSGAVDLYALTFGGTSPLNVCEKLYLEDLSPADVARLVGLFSRLGVRVGAGAAERVYYYTEGQPYLTMRLCALLETAAVEQVIPQAVDGAVERMLVEDDNIRHIIRELEGNLLGRRRLSEILAGRSIPFSRNDPVLAGLEMLGAIRGTQPCRIRNPIYALALRPYLQRRD